MPDFDVNEGYIAATRRRADSSLFGLPIDGLSIDGRVAPYGLDVTPQDMLESAYYGLSDDLGLLEELGLEGVYGSSPEEHRLDSDPAAAHFGSPHKLPERTPVVRRTRHLATGHLSVADAPRGRRVGVRLIARRRRLARRACPYGWQVRVLGSSPRRRRCLWTKCHGSR